MVAVNHVAAAGGARGRRPLAGRVRAAVRRDGLGRTLRRALRRLAAPLVDTGTLVFFVRDLEEPLPEAPGSAGYRAREAHPAEAEAVRDGSDPGRSVDSIRERFRRGNLCFVAVGPRGEVGHTRWVTAAPAHVPELRRNLLPAPGDAYFYDGYTHPDARRLGLDGVIRCAIFRALRERGYRRAVSYVRADNPAGLRAAERWQRPAGRIRYLSLAGGAPRLLGAGRVAPLAFSPDAVLDGDEEERVRGWKEWFRGWLEQPLDRRSTGFSALPEDYFEATADFVAGALDLDPAADSVLDVGCSSAGVSRRMARRARTLTGVDATPGLVADGARLESGSALRFGASDARLLPFADGSFQKVYCTGVIHTLPSHEDGLQVVRELIRVCAPGGRVLVGALPDRSKRWSARREAWRRGTPRERLELLASVLLPAPLKNAARRTFGLPRKHRLVALEYDLEALARRLQSLDPSLRCERLAYPEDFWSRDFRETRSNLLIRLPG